MAYRVKVCGQCPHREVLRAHHDSTASHYACIDCPVDFDGTLPPIGRFYPRPPRVRKAARRRPVRLDADIGRQPAGELVSI